jgi:hypothetical protein
MTTAAFRPTATPPLAARCYRAVSVGGSKSFSASRERIGHAAIALPEGLADGCTSSLVSSQYKIAPRRALAVGALARHDDDTATAALVDCLDDHDQDVRIAAVEALAGRNDPSAGAALMNCLGAYSDKVRQATVKTLAS